MACGQPTSFGTNYAFVKSIAMLLKSRYNAIVKCHEHGQSYQILIRLAFNIRQKGFQACLKKDYGVTTTVF